MQYYLKIFNTTTNEVVGYYKGVGRNCISRLPTRIKFWNDWESALAKAKEIDNGFVRDADKKYYTAFVVVCGDNEKQLKASDDKSDEKEEEFKNVLETFIRKNSNRSGE